MNILKSNFIIQNDIDGITLIKNIEKYGRTAYKSDDSISKDSADKFIKKLINKGHESVLEHEKVTVKVLCDRGVSHEIVRHRIASYTQESTRYCNYSKDKFGNEITMIRPSFWNSEGKDKEKYRVWHDAMVASEKAYMKLIELGARPEEARSVLPNSLKTEIIISMNLREWRHFFKLRTAGTAHPQMREIARPLLVEFKKQIPAVFDDIHW